MKTRVKQGDVMSRFIFLVVVNWIMKTQQQETKQGSDGTSRQN